MRLNDRGGQGSSGDTGSQDQVFLSTKQAWKNNDFDICLEGRNRDSNPVLSSAEGSLECL